MGGGDANGCASKVEWHLGSRARVGIRAFRCVSPDPGNPAHGIRQAWGLATIAVVRPASGPHGRLCHPAPDASSAHFAHRPAQPGDAGGQRE